MDLRVCDSWCRRDVAHGNTGSGFVVPEPPSKGPAADAAVSTRPKRVWAIDAGGNEDLPELWVASGAAKCEDAAASSEYHAVIPPWSPWSSTSTRVPSPILPRSPASATGQSLGDT